MISRRHLSQICRGLSAYDSVIECPITAGRDSRLLAALLVRNGISAEYFSSGPLSSPDVTIGTAVAKRLNLPHRAGVIPHRAPNEQELDNAAVLAQWATASRRLLGQTDGMVTLANIANAIGHPQQIDRLRIHLYGIGGEIARPFYLKDRRFYYLFEHSAE